MMGPDQYFLSKIAEEANEVAKRALKAQQFGIYEVQQGQDFDNFERLVMEFHDLVTTFDEMICRTARESAILPTNTVRKVRLKKMQKYLKLSQELNQVTNDFEI